MKTARLPFILIVLAFLILSCSANSEADFDRGMQAYDREDYAEALRALRPLAERGHADAQSQLARMYTWGDGVDSDLEESMRWYRLAAEQGHAGAQSALGHRFESGRGVRRDYVESVRWYRLAADQGDVHAQFRLGLLYSSDQRDFGNPDRGLSKDYGKSARYYRMAAEQGHAMAQTLLGSSYAKGRGVPQDYVLAYKWSNLGAANGGFGAAGDRDEVASSMTPAQIAEAQKLAREWLAERE